MGVLPLVFKAGENAESLGLNGQERLSIAGLIGELRPRQDLTVSVSRKDGSTTRFLVTARLDTPVEINYWRNGGILQTVLRKMLKG
jgi:aconitate hydratase